MIRGFGGGIQCGLTCGALDGAVAALGLMKKGEDKKVIGKFCKGFVELFMDEFEESGCKELVKTHKDPETRCLSLVETTAELLEEYVEHYNNTDNTCET